MERHEVVVGDVVEVVNEVDEAVEEVDGIVLVDRTVMAAQVAIVGALNVAKRATSAESVLRAGAISAITVKRRDTCRENAANQGLEDGVVDAVVREVDVVAAAIVPGAIVDVSNAAKTATSVGSVQKPENRDRFLATDVEMRDTCRENALREVLVYALTARRRVIFQEIVPSLEVEVEGVEEVVREVGGEAEEVEGTALGAATVSRLIRKSPSVAMMMSREEVGCI